MTENEQRTSAFQGANNDGLFNKVYRFIKRKQTDTWRGRKNGGSVCITRNNGKIK